MVLRVLQVASRQRAQRTKQENEHNQEAAIARAETNDHDEISKKKILKETQCQRGLPCIQVFASV
jgi:hypothetical protein